MELNLSISPNASPQHEWKLGLTGRGSVGTPFHPPPTRFKKVVLLLSLNDSARDLTFSSPSPCPVNHQSIQNKNKHDSHKCITITSSINQSSKENKPFRSTVSCLMNCQLEIISIHSTSFPSICPPSCQCLNPSSRLTPPATPTPYI